MIQKPWEKRRQVNTNLSEAIQQNNINIQPIAETNIPNTTTNSISKPQSSGTLIPSSTNSNGIGQNSTTGTLGMYNTMNNFGTGYNNSLGSFGNSYGGYGSTMYGGYGNQMNSGYGNSMYGGYSNFNRFGMMGNGDITQQNFLQSGLMFLNSFGQVVQSLGEIARTIEMNTQGLANLFQSIFNLGKRMKGWGIDFYNFLKNILKNVCQKVMEFLKSKVKILFVGDSQNHVKTRMRIQQTILKVALGVFILSMIPILKNLLKQDPTEAIFANLQNEKLV